MKINWFRGVVRLWLVLTVVWLGVVGTVVLDEATYAVRYHFDRGGLQRDANRLAELEIKAGPQPAPEPDAGPWTKYSGEAWKKAPIVWDDAPLRAPGFDWLAVLILPPVGAILAIAMTRWILRGFSP